MRGIGIIIGGVAAVACLGGAPAYAAAASDPAVVADVHCLLMSTLASNATDPDVKAGGEFGLAYYLGRIDSHQPAVDLESTMKAEGPKMNATIDKDVQRCGAEIQKRASDFNAMGARVEAEFKATAPAQPPAGQAAKPAAPAAPPPKPH
jgi:hypothetical protein